jgi:hypothetical protein
MQNVNDLSHVLMMNTGGLGITPNDLPRYTCSIAGFNSTDHVSGNDITFDEIIAVIIHWQTTHTMFPGEYTGQNTQPQCYSLNGIQGVGDPGVYCGHCEFNAWGSKGRGKACRESRDVYVMLPNSKKPNVLQVPPSSIKVFHDFLLNLDICFYEALVSFKICIEKNRDSIKFAKLQPSLIARLSPDEAEFMRTYRERFINSLNKVNKRVEQDEEREQYCEIPAEAMGDSSRSDTPF